LADYLKGPFFIFSHSLNFGSVDWIGNFRSGFLLNISNSFTYNFFYSDNGRAAWQGDLSVSANGHFIIGGFMGIATRLFYRHWFFTDTGLKQGYYDEAGDVLRGVLDTNVTANSMLSLNLDISFKVLEFRPSKWFSNSNFWRVFDFDLHTGPFFDMALYNNPMNKDSFSFRNTLLTAGLEIVIFPLRWRSLLLRISYGHNFSLTEKNSLNELYIGTELHF